MANRDLVIQIRLPRWSARRWAAVVMVLVFVGGAIAYGNVMWTPFAQGEKLSSAKMNANFMAMADAINTLQGTPPGSAPQPHVVANVGNTDLGIYLGTTFVQSGWSVMANGTAVNCFEQLPSGKCLLPLVYSFTVKAPMIIGMTVSLRYDGKNCTGNAFVEPAETGVTISNYSFNTQGGTIYQLNGAPQTFQQTSFMDNNGNCTPQMLTRTGMLPVMDTKVPNIAVTDLSQTHLVLM